MKFSCTKENLSHALSLVGSLANRHSNLPILMNVLIRAAESHIEVVATNLEVAAKATVRAKVETTGAFTVPAKTLSDYVLLLTGESVDCSLVENELFVVCANAKTKIKGAPADEFPVMPDPDEAHGYVVDAQSFKTALSQTSIAVAKNEIRPELAGLFFGFFTDRHKGLLLAATDSYRLAERKVEVSQGNDAVSCIVPARTVYEMIRLLSTNREGQSEKTARLWAGGAQIGMRFNDVELTSRLIDGRYPDYAQIIPHEFKTMAAVPTDVFIKSIKAASLFSTTGVNGVSLDVNSQEQTIGVSSTSAQTGEHAATIDAQVQGEENSILLNYRYVLEGLQHMEGSDVTLSVNSADTPCLLQSKEGREYVYIVMPIRK